MTKRIIIAVAAIALMAGSAAISGQALAGHVDPSHGQGGGSNNVREYWIQADDVRWDYAPSGMNLMAGREFEGGELVFVGPGDGLIGRVYKKAIYRLYTDGWKKRIRRGPREEHLGILGPVIRAEVGDTIIVHFRNNTRNKTLSVHPHGVFYDKSSEGAPYSDDTNEKADDFVSPRGGTHTYIWGVPERAGPGPSDPSSIAWEYHSHTNETADTNAGLVGMITVTRKGMALPDGRPIDVDREFFTMFAVLDENVSLYIDENIRRFGGDPGNPDFEESNLMHGMNGLLWGNNTGYAMYVGEHVRWYVLSMGTEVDLHTPHWHGVTLLHNGNRIDVTEVLPAAIKTLDFRPDNPGIWMYHCHVNDHLDAGMMTRFEILN